MTTVGLVTGAGRGMGLECARKLVGTVDVLLLVDLVEASAVEAARELSDEASGTVVEPFVLDVTDTAGLERLVGRVRELGTLRSVVHAAGISPTMADWRRILTVDLIGTALLSEALRPLATAGTAFVCFASMAPLLGGPASEPAVAKVLDTPLDEKFLERLHDVLPVIEDTGLAYSCAKHGVHRFVWHEAVRLGEVGARICSLSPGIIDTVQSHQEGADNPTVARLVGATPLGRMGRPEEVAKVVAFMVSDDASFLNGIDILVDGGVLASMKSSAAKA